MRIIISAIVILSLIASVAIGSEAPDEYRQTVRSDPLIHSIIVALSAKHGCPWLHEPHGNGGMQVMKEVEPFFYSKRRKGCFSSIRTSNCPMYARGKAAVRSSYLKVDSIPSRDW